MRSVNPYLNFNGNTEEAFKFYQSVFGGELSVTRFKDFRQMEGMPPLSEADGEKIGHISLPLGNGAILMGTDALESLGMVVTPGNNYHITLETDTAEEADRIFNALSEGGRVEMPLQKTEWAEKYGSFVDRYGVQWMVNYTGDVQWETSEEGQ